MIRAADIASALGAFEPTAEQVAIIEAPLEGTYRVIAGAGSGKTETMAQRVLWLVANGHCEARDVLGLTFTRKAAGELATRVGQRLGELGASGMVPVSDEFEGPQISTYNSFASRLYREYAPLLGRDPDAQVLSEASAWGLARRVVVASTHEALAHWDYSVTELTRVVRLLAARVGENSVSASDIEKFSAAFAALVDLPPGGTGRYAEVEEWVHTVGSLVPMMTLVEDYARAKAARGVIEFSDQVALALTLVENHPDIALQVRSDHAVVLLDEYQDTSVAQARLLGGLFPNHPVMAVGDPYQAIYGWRGASSSNLADIETSFGGSPVETFTLSTSWRNGSEILVAANTLSQALSTLPGPDVGVLSPAPDASAHPVDVVVSETLEDEAECVAQWMMERLAEGNTPASAAVLVRGRTHQRVFVDALTRHGVPVHVLGIGGLLDDPVVADIVCTLRVITQPHADTELVRLLAGARWRLGVADLHALSGTARWLEGRAADGSALDPEAALALKNSVAPGDHAGLRDAVSFITRAPGSHHQRENYTDEGLARIADLEATLRRLNDAHVATLDEAIFLVERELGLDVEILAHPERSRSVAAREALMDAVQTYLAVSDDASVVGFVQWLAEAESRDNLTPRQEPPEPGCVQVLTIHGAKGLEWDVVAIPRLVEGELPSSSRDSKGWLSRGELPYDFRGDRESLPEFSWRSATTRKEAKDAFEDFVEAVADHRGAEERRLMYVAITRAKHRALLTGSFWATGQKPRGPSIFLRELESAGLCQALPLAPESETPPEKVNLAGALWPADPLGSRRQVVEDAAGRVREAMASPASSAHNPEVARVGEEIRRGAGALPELILPARIPASSLERLLSDPSAYRDALLRPVPRKPQSAAVRGTLFHRYVEQRLGSTVPGGLFDPEDDYAEMSTTLSIEQWQERFDASEFAGLSPVAIEAELHLPVAGHIVVCKIDAVFPTDTGVRIIDWKTGKAPKTPAELEAKSIQLSAYRLAWSSWTGLSPENIEAAFWFVDDSAIVTPSRLIDYAELDSRLGEALGAISNAKRLAAG
jgi:DNA helicase-2/ATP-dependent DNA helicase PcrA